MFFNKSYSIRHRRNSCIKPARMIREAYVILRKCFFKSLIALRFTSSKGVGYSVLQCNIVILSTGTLLFIKIETDCFISSIVAIPVDMIIFLSGIESLAIFSRYGKFNNSPEGIFHIFCFKDAKKSIESSSKGVEKTSKFKTDCIFH